MTGKVAAIVMRAASDGSGRELLVLQHPMAGVQLPAGSLHDGEHPADGCARELYEETGLGGDDLQLIDEVGTWIEEPSGLARHAFQVQCLRETPDEWWVVTTDGGGLCWRCHWLPVDGAEPLHPLQRPWLDRVRGELLDVTGTAWAWAPVPDELVDETTVDVFFAPGVGDRWYTVSWLPASRGEEPVARQAVGFAVTDDGDAVVVRHGDGRLSIPGGTREPGEGLREALQRELREEACARVVDAELLGFVRAACRGAAGVSDVHYGSRWWARVELDAWAPRFETVQRRLIPYSDVLGNLPAWRYPTNERWITAAIAVEHGRR